MPYDVSSWFVDQTLLRNPSNLVRKFTIGSSDYSDRVSKWPSFKRKWDDIRPLTTTLQLANVDGALNFFHSDPTMLRQDCAIQFGYSHPSSGDELITMFSGKTEKAKYRSEKVSLTIVDKFKQLTERKVGTKDAPVDFTGSNYLPSDIAWTLVTCYGGFSDVQSTSNPDINYESFLTWANVFSSSSILMQGSFTGQKVSEGLRKIARHTWSAVFERGDVLEFHRFGLSDANVTSLDNSSIEDLTIEISDKETVNKQYVYADYNVGSESWAVSVFEVSTSSINSYGVREEIEQDENIWYVNSQGALDLAQRMTSLYAEPYPSISGGTYLNGFLRLVGETLTVVDSFHGINRGYRIMGQEINMDNATMEFEIDPSQYSALFTLDTSQLDGGDVLG